MQRPIIEQDVIDFVLHRVADGDLIVLNGLGDFEFQLFNQGQEALVRVQRNMKRGPAHEEADRFLEGLTSPIVKKRADREG